jgi:hypothetical protein
MSSVSPWSGLQSSRHPPSFDELSDKIAAVNARLDAQERKLSALADMRRQEQPKTVLSDSTSFSQEMLANVPSRQMERYHSTEESWDRLREEFSSYRSQS